MTPTEWNEALADENAELIALLDVLRQALTDAPTPQRLDMVAASHALAIYAEWYNGPRGSALRESRPEASDPTPGDGA